MKTHQLQLSAIAFDAIVSGEKTIESRLNDGKRQLIRIGDRIEFTNRDDLSQKVAVEVIGLLHYATFRHLFLHNDTAKFGAYNVEQLEEQINEFYSDQSQALNGVVGIEFVR